MGNWVVNSPSFPNKQITPGHVSYLQRFWYSFFFFFFPFWGLSPPDPIPLESRVGSSQMQPSESRMGSSQTQPPLPSRGEGMSSVVLHSRPLSRITAGCEWHWPSLIQCPWATPKPTVHTCPQPINSPLPQHLTLCSQPH